MDPAPPDAPRKASRRPKRWLRGWRRLGLAGLLVAVFATIALQQTGLWADDSVDVEPVPTASDQLSSQERAYYDFVAPRLRELSAQARELARLGEAKSRDIFAIRAHGDRLNELSDELDTFLAASGTPPRFDGVDAGYREGVELTRRAMQEAQRGFLTFDWDRVARAVPVFVAGADRLEMAVSDLDVAGGMATPNASPAD